MSVVLHDVSTDTYVIDAVFPPLLCDGCSQVSPRRAGTCEALIRRAKPNKNLAPVVSYT